MNLKSFSLLGVFALLSLPFLASCDGKKEGEINGVRYIVHVSNKDGKQASQNEMDSMFVKGHLKMYNHTDSLVRNTYEQDQPVFIPIFGDLFFKDLLKMLHVGDSVTFFLSADSIFKGTQMPPVFQTGTMVRNELKVTDIISIADYQKEMQAIQEKALKEYQEKMMEMQKKQAALETEAPAALDKWVAEKGIKTKRTKSGIHYVIEKKGEGTPKTGDILVVHYKGTLLDGKVFDSSYERGKPFETAIGVGQVIKGWDEGIPLLGGKGGKGTLYIPANLAYGAQDRDPIPAGSSLIFEVEILDVKPAQSKEATQK